MSSPPVPPRSPSRPPGAAPLAPTPPRGRGRVVLVMGKGGVGKTTIAAGLAVLDSDMHGKAVLLEFGDGESGRRALGVSGRSVEHLVVKPEHALVRAATTLFRSETLTKLVLGNFAVRPLVRAAPAIRELAMMETLRLIAAERPGVRIVVDMPATGHGLAWLRVARQGMGLLGSGPLYEMCARLERELLTPEHASVVVVTLPEPLVIEETLELCAAVAAEGALVVDHVVVNRMPRTLPAAALGDARAFADETEDPRNHPRKHAASKSPLHLEAARKLARVLAARDTACREALEAVVPLVHGSRAVWRIPAAPSDPSSRDVAGWLRAEGAA